ncbi:MAG: hypothetical protein SF069_12930 [Phycisphaerae bacterium]|nr:hypothetical protein [Phycisphaerae bacterium]
MKNMMFAAALAAAVVGSAFAGPTPVVANGTYRLFNHDGGGAQPPAYGLRLDGLDLHHNTRIYSFDFENAQSDMKMTVNHANGTIRIFGQVYGGRDVGSSYENPANGRVGLWQIDFTYRNGVQTLGSGEIIAQQSPLNNGFIKPLFNSTVAAFAGNPLIPLVDFMMPSFHLGLNHRGEPGVSGWGWVNHSNRNHVAASDWLFTVGAEPIPEPATASLSILGVALISALRRR